MMQRRLAGIVGLSSETTSGEEQIQYIRGLIQGVLVEFRFGQVGSEKIDLTDRNVNQLQGSRVPNAGNHLDAFTLVEIGTGVFFLTGRGKTHVVRQ